MATSETTADQCPECNSSVRPDGVEHICESCGLVVDTDDIDHGPEWRGKRDENGDEKSRVSKYIPTRYDQGLGSEVGFHTERSSAKDRKLQTMNKRVRCHSKKTRNLSYATGEIHRIAEKMGLPERTREQAKRLFRQFHEEVNCHGLDLDAVAPACLYVSARCNRDGVGPERICEYARDVESKRLLRRQNKVVQKLGVPVPPPRPEDRMSVIAGRVGLDQSVINRAMDTLERIDETVQCRGSPSTLAARLLYDSQPGEGDKEVTKAEIADAAGVSTAGMRQRL